MHLVGSVVSMSDNREKWDLMGVNFVGNMEMENGGWIGCCVGVVGNSVCVEYLDLNILHDEFRGFAMLQSQLLWH